MLFRYADADGARDPKPNVNGAINSIAGILNEKLQRARPDAAPGKPRRRAIGCTDGRGLFAGLVAHFAQAA